MTHFSIASLLSLWINTNVMKKILSIFLIPFFIYSQDCIDDDYTMQVGLSVWTSGINGCEDGIDFLENAGYPCNTTLSALNNPFWGSNPNETLANICGCTCEDQLPNYCEDLNACNYGEIGECEYIPFGTCDCNGNLPDFGYDCDGNCLNDIDGDGICDQDDDCVGQYDECGECNGNGPAEYYDCEGNCLNDIDNDGICDEFDNCLYNEISVNIEGSDSEIGWNIAQSNGWAVLSGALDSYSNFCIQDDCWIFNMYDGNGGDGWFETNYYIFYSNTNELISSGTLIDGNYCSVDIQIGDSVSCQNVYGCTDYNACNYNCEANIDDFSCEYADPYYVDCDGVCINDFDQDGICDELETNPCEQYPNPGPCFAAITVYFFNQQSSQCEETTWGGCDGVVPFWTLQECENECENNSSNEEFDSSKLLIKRINILGQESISKGIVIELFEDGNVKKKYN